MSSVDSSTSLLLLSVSDTTRDVVPGFLPEGRTPIFKREERQDDRYGPGTVGPFVVEIDLRRPSPGVTSEHRPTPVRPSEIPHKY